MAALNTTSDKSQTACPMSEGEKAIGYPRQRGEWRVLPECVSPNTQINPTHNSPAYTQGVQSCSEKSAGPVNFPCKFHNHDPQTDL